MEYKLTTKKEGELAQTISGTVIDDEMILYLRKTGVSIKENPSTWPQGFVLGVFVSVILVCVGGLLFT